MSRNRLACLALLLLALPAAAQQSAEESLASLSVAEGLELTLFAAEPMLVNPTCIDVDAEGRVWVAEAANYRLFNQDMARPEGDRIVVLEDTDGDGKADDARTFYQDPSLQAPLGIAVLGDRVYVAQSPDLFYLRDTDGDGVADEKKVILTGFGGVDHDHAIHGLVYGPDGWLYFSVGDRGLDVTDKSGHRVFAGKDAPYRAATVLRTDLEGKHLELLAENMRNNYEPALDSFGNIFISDNDDDGNEQTRINYVMEGGSYGYWPRRKGDRKLDEVHWNTDRPGTVPTMLKTGFGSPTGMLFYEGDLLPEAYRNTLIHADAGPRVIRSYRPIPDGAGFSAEMKILVEGKDDTWFRPSDVCTAPDGSVFISDWYDPGVGGHRMGDVLRGRIYRLAPVGTAYDVPRLHMGAEDSHVAAALQSANHALRYTGDLIARSMIENGQEKTIKSLFANDNATARARGAWILATDPAMRAEVLKALTDRNAVSDRILAMRIVAEYEPTKLLDYEFQDDSDPQVRRQLLLELTRRPEANGLRTKVVPQLALQYDGEDRFYREALGIGARGIESYCFTQVLREAGDTWDARLAGLAIQWHPAEAFPVAEAAARNNALSADLRQQAIKAIEVQGTEAAGALLVALLDTGLPAEVTEYTLHLLARDEGDAWRKTIQDDAFQAWLDAALDDAALQPAASSFAAETRQVILLPRLLTAALDESAELPPRRDALNAIARLAPNAMKSKAEESVAALKPLLANENALIGTHALNAISAFQHMDTTPVLQEIVTNADYSKLVRIDAVQQLGGNKSGAVLLMNLVEQDELPADLRIEVQELAHASAFDDVRMMAEQLLPREVTSEGNALPPMADLVAMSGDAEAGRTIFFSPEKAECSRCHQVNGEGKEVGPDLSKIGEKYGREALLESILNPSAAISHEYKVYIVNSAKEGFLSGFIRSEDKDGFELMDSAGQVLRIENDDVKQKVESAVSLMPTGLAAAMTAQDLSDLVAYLETLK